MASYGPDAKDDDILSEAKEAFKEAAEQEQENRERALADLRFARMYEQWDEKIIKKREAEGKPVLTFPRLQTFSRQVVNDARQNKPASKVRPVDSKADVETAEIYNGIIRHIEANSRADIAYDTAGECAVDRGVGYWRIVLDYAHDDTFDMDIRIKEISDPFSVYGDPYATSLDGSDWMSGFVTENLSHKRFEQEYPGAQISSWESASEGWVTEDTIRVAEYWTREKVERKIVLLSNGGVADAERLEKDRDYAEELAIAGIRPVEGRVRTVASYKVKQCILTDSEVLSRNDWPGRFIPIVPVYGDVVNEEGKRHLYSLIHPAIDAQRQFNFARTAATEILQYAPKVPYIGPKRAFAAAPEKWATANTQAWSYIEYDGDVPPQRQQLDATAFGYIQEALSASEDMKNILGIHDASLGLKGNETSGKAIIARQREGDTSTFHFIDNLTRSIRHSSYILVDLIPHVWDDERIVRLMGEDGTVTEQKVNGPVPVLDDQGQPIMQPNPLGGPPVPKTRVFSLTEGKYDLTATAGPSYTTKREEAADQMIEFVRGFPQAAPVIGDLLAKNLDWPGADEIAERLQALYQKTYGGDQDGIPPQVKAQIQQGMALIQQLQGELSALKADKAIDQMKARTDAFEAETDRMKVIGEYKINMLDQQWNWAQPHSIIEPSQQQPTPRAPQPPFRQNGAM